MACPHGKQCPSRCKICDPVKYAAKLAYCKGYRESNRDKIRAYFEATRDERLAYGKAYREANKCEHGRLQQCGICRPHNAIIKYKYGAKKRGYVWELSDAQAAWLMQQPCAYCEQEVAGGIDRAKNEFGYTVLNSVPCCTTCNFTKMKLTVKAFIVAVNQIARYCPDYPKFKRRWERIRKKLTQLGEQDAAVFMDVSRVRKTR
jgi:hypothetical protein